MPRYTTDPITASELELLRSAIATDQYRIAKELAHATGVRRSFYEASLKEYQSLETKLRNRSAARAINDALDLEAVEGTEDDEARE